MTAECLACKDGVTEAEYCITYPLTLGCKPVPEPCCKEMIAKCLACDEDVSPAEYCLKYPLTVGCKTIPSDTCLEECKPCDGCVAPNENCELPCDQEKCDKCNNV